ncbi:MAG TPA: hypothetical protein VIF83_09675 [Gemmatimonadaceae bacterium]
MPRICCGAIPVMAVLLAVPQRAVAQEPQQCVLQFESRTEPRTRLEQLPSGKYNAFQGGGVTYHCEGQGNTLVADSAEYYGEQGVLYLIGHVHYSEPRARVNSERMTYYQLEDRLHAEGNVDVTLRSGTTMTGPEMDYYRVTVTRPLARAVATGRPRMKLIETDAQGKPGAPVDVLANAITAEGDNLVYASGRVEITKPDMISRSDSAMLDSEHEFVQLTKTPTVESRTGRPFSLAGGTIDLYSRQRILWRVVATPGGRVISQDLELLADSVDLRVRDNQLQRVMAWGSRSRAKAVSPEREIIADSIDAVMPGQVLREVRAMRDAYVNSVADTARIESTERDWMRGESIIAQFDPVATAKGETKPRPRQIVATGDASSFYQLQSNTVVRSQPSINYVRGKIITVSFTEGEVNTVDVVEQAAGVYLEPGGSETEEGGRSAIPGASRPTQPTPTTTPPKTGGKTEVKTPAPKSQTKRDVP